MSIEDKRNALISAFEILPDRDERLSYLLSMARKFPPLEEDAKTDERLIPGCVSRLWLVPEFKNQRCHYRMDADALISKGIAAVLCNLYSNEEPHDIIALEPDFLAEVGVTEHLSPNRRNGLTSLRLHIKGFAESCLEKSTP